MHQMELCKLFQTVSSNECTLLALLDIRAIVGISGSRVALIATLPHPHLTATIPPTSRVEDYSSGNT